MRIVSLLSARYSFEPRRTVHSLYERYRRATQSLYQSYHYSFTGVIATTVRSLRETCYQAAQCFLVSCRRAPKPRSSSSRPSRSTELTSRRESLRCASNPNRPTSQPASRAAPPAGSILNPRNPRGSAETRETSGRVCIRGVAMQIGVRTRDTRPVCGRAGARTSGALRQRSVHRNAAERCAARPKVIIDI